MALLGLCDEMSGMQEAIHNWITPPDLRSKQRKRAPEK